MCSVQKHTKCTVRRTGTGSCSKTVEGAENDDLPALSVKAHDGRVTGGHAMRHTTHTLCSTGRVRWLLASMED
jgi:hypothetical protein